MRVCAGRGDVHFLKRGGGGVIITSRADEGKWRQVCRWAGMSCDQEECDTLGEECTFKKKRVGER